MPKNFLKIPPDVVARLKTFALDDVVAACAKRIKPSDIAKYADLGLRLNERGELVAPEAFVPNPTAGKYSRINVDGKEVVRKDLPKISKDFSFYAPSWGSSSYHLVTHTREVYIREFIPPKQVMLEITVLEGSAEGHLVKFAIDQVIDRRAPDFEDDLLYNLNILQENVGTVDVFESTATLEDYAATIRVDWELLPAGQMSPEDVVRRILDGKRPISVAHVATMQERLAMFARLRPTHFISGTSGFVRYFGAKYADDFVVFENLQYGNAMYVMFENWQELSKKSRIDLLKGPHDGFERIEHREGWEDRLGAMLDYYRTTHRR
jgi:hypothetical protein